MNNVYKTIYVETDTLGNCIKVIESKTLTSEKVEELKKSAKSYREQQLKLQKEKDLQEKEKNKIFANKQHIKSVFIAKNYFDNLVDRGLTETSEEFETNFNLFVLGVAELDKTVMPSKFAEILERLE